MKRKQFEQSFEQSYPHITRWARTHGWIEIREEYTRLFVTALDIGGMIWEGWEQSEYATMDDKLCALGEGLAAWLHEQLGEHES